MQFLQLCHFGFCCIDFVGQWYVQWSQGQWARWGEAFDQVKDLQSSWGVKILERRQPAAFSLTLFRGERKRSFFFVGRECIESISCQYYPAIWGAISNIIFFAAFVYNAPRFSNDLNHPVATISQHFRITAFPVNTGKVSEQITRWA